MAATRQDILQIVLNGVREFNELQPPASRLPLTEDTALLGHDHALDSLGIVNLVAAIEDGVQARYGIAISLTPDGNAAEDPWRTVGTLADFITSRLDARPNAVADRL